jgi:hypothetical protein
MKKQLNPNIKAHLLRSAFYLLLLLGVCAIPFALAQRQLLRNDVQSTNLPWSQVPQTTTRAHPISVPAPPQAPQVILYDQYDNAGTNATSSQDFEASLDAFDDELADDFVVPGGQTWNVDSIDADGVYFNGAGPAQNFNVRFYSNSGGLPGALVDSRIGMSYVQVGSTFTVTVSPAVSLAAGTYWVSVQARQDFTPAGQWGWTDRTVQSNSAAAWQNPGAGFGTPCTTWGQRGSTCGIDPGVPDQVYRLNGTIGGGGTPTPTPTASPTCTPIEVTGDISLGDPTQIDRLFRSGIPQTCPPSTFCAIFGDPTPRHYDSYSFANTTGATQCVNINTDTPCTGTNFIFTGAYLNSFDPNNICTNWIGDSGSSPNPAQAFDVEVPAGETLVVVVSEVTANAGCSSYTVTVSGICPSPTPTPTPGAIRLRFSAHQRDGFKVVQLKYIGATSPTVDIFRNGALLATATNDGTYQDVLTERGIFTYQVCEAGTSNCSNEVEVRFRGP